MRPWIFLLFVYECFASPSFILSGPKKFQKGGNENLCLTLFNATKNGNLVFDLKLSATENRTYNFPIGHECYSIAVPDVETSWEGGELNFTAVFEDGSTVGGSKKVIFQDASSVTLIQTDKPWYKPGQLVRFRLLSLDYQLMPILEEFSTVLVEDPNGIVIDLWKKVSMAKGMAQLELQLSSEPVQGVWKIKAKQGTVETTQEFSVKEFELPRFEVQLNVPEKIGINQTFLEIETCARYTYGQPVQMNYTVFVAVARRWDGFWRESWPRLIAGPLVVQGPNTAEKNITLTGKGLGCHTSVVNVSAMVSSEHSHWNRWQVGIIAIATEDGTGVTFNTSAEVQIEEASFNLQLTDLGTFKLGVPVIGEAKLSTSGKEAVAGRTVKLCLSATCTNTTFEQVCANFTTDGAGKVPYSFVPVITECYAYSLSAELSEPSFARGSVQFTQVYSVSGNSLEFGETKIKGGCEGELQLPLLFSGSEGDELSLRWQLISRGDIVFSKQEVVSYTGAAQPDLKLVNNLLEKSQNADSTKKLLGRLRMHTFSYNITSKDGPLLAVMVYAVRKDGEILTAVKKIEVEPCFPNKVEMKWSSGKRKPGEKVKLSISGYQGSYCGTSVVDKSVTLLQPESQLNENNIFTRLRDFIVGEYEGDQQVTNDEDHCSKKFPAKEKRSIVRRPWHWSRYITYHKEQIAAFDGAGLFILSNLDIESRPCEKRSVEYITTFLPYYLARPIPAPAFLTTTRPNLEAAIPIREELDMAPLTSSEELTSSVEVRSYFPETWLWDGFVLNDEGQHEEGHEAPHTITTWIGRTLCVSKEIGFGMSPKTELEVFQLFFVELNLPYSVKRGEVLTLKISTFNYASHALPIVVRMPVSTEYDIVSGNTGSSKCVQSQTKAVHIFQIKPKVLGNVNITVDALIDELHDAKCGPEVIPSAKDTVVKPLLVIAEGLPVEKTFSSLICPQDFEEDKATTWNITVPENAVQGSARGWVNIVGDIMGPAISGLDSLVRMPTGCGEQNMVIFTPIVYVLQYLEATDQVDPQISKKATGYLKVGYQRELTYRHDDGSYSAFGDTDPSGSMWLTAFVVRSFAGATKFINVDQEDFEKSFKWILSKQMENGCFPSVGKVLHRDLKGGIKDEDSPVGLTAFVVAALAEANVTGSEKAIKDALVCLKAETNQTNYVLSLTTYAIAKAGDKDGAKARIAVLLERAKRESGLLWWEQGDNKALAVEMSAYNLMTLTLLSQEAGDKDSKVLATSIVRWISRQRNGNGGFYSTQDTVVALQAIAFYASSFSIPLQEVMLSIVATELEGVFSVNEENKLVQKQINLPVVPTALEVDAFGQGCVVAQAVLRYNIPVEKEKESFKVNANVSNELQVAGCVTYLDNDVTNMAVVDIEILSGHVPNKDSMKKLKGEGANGIKRVDVNDGHVFLYYDELDSKERCFRFDLDKEFEVSDLKAASVVVYDYYATQKRGTSELQPPPLKSKP